MKPVFVLSRVLGGLSVLTACETVKFFGKDIANAGEAMEDGVK